MLPKERPCDSCSHKRVCAAREKFDEIEVKVPHEFFKVKITCTQYLEMRAESKPKVIGGA